MSTATKELEVVRLTDEELVRTLYETIGKLDDIYAAERLDWLAGEVVERFAPDVERLITVTTHYRDCGTVDEAEAEIEATEESWERRAGMRSKFKSLYEQMGGDDA